MLRVSVAFSANNAPIITYRIDEGSEYRSYQTSDILRYRYSQNQTLWCSTILNIYLSNYRYFDRSSLHYNCIQNIDPSDDPISQILNILTVITIRLLLRTIAHNYSLRTKLPSWKTKLPRSFLRESSTRNDLVIAVIFYADSRNRWFYRIGQEDFPYTYIYIFIYIFIYFL